MGKSEDEKTKLENDLIQRYLANKTDLHGLYSGQPKAINKGDKYFEKSIGETAPKAINKGDKYFEKSIGETALSILHAMNNDIDEIKKNKADKSDINLIKAEIANNMKLIKAEIAGNTKWIKAEIAGNTKLIKAEIAGNTKLIKAETKLIKAEIAGNKEKAEDQFKNGFYVLFTLICIIIVGLVAVYLKN